jgi:hypothetical protein
MRLTMPLWPTESAPPHLSSPMFDGSATVIQFRPRTVLPRRGNDFRTWRAADDSPVSDIDSFEYAPESDEAYRNRMRVNFVAAVFLVLLMSIGDWVINAMVEARQTEYCYLADAGHCALNYVPMSKHS